jgi:hypothetical protein
MKLPYLLLVTVTLATAVACTQKNETAAPSAEVKVAKTAVQDLEISADTANVNKARWNALRATYLQMLTAARMDTSFITQGFSIRREELQEILDSVGPAPEVWAMLGVGYDAQGKPYPRLIFQAEGSKTNGTYKYFDFSRPCPTNCPK